MTIPRSRRSDALITSSRLAIGIAAFSFALPAYAQAADAAPPPAQARSGDTAAEQDVSATPRPSQANEQVAEQAAGSANSTDALADSGASAQAAVDDAIVVTGTRASLQGAIARKKNAGTQVDSIVAEDIASFPDKNIGEALQRVTGVQLTRDFGEGSQVSIRGVEPDLNRVEINGASVLGNGGLGNRGADFRELASELVKSIDVFKGFTADMTEGGVGGTVSILTRRPLELKKPLLAATGSMQYLDTLKTWRPRGNVVAGGKLLNNRLGVLVNLTYDRNDSRSDFIRNTEWVRFSGNSDQTDLNNDNKKITENSNFTNVTTPAGCNSIATTVTTPGATRNDCLVQFAEYVPRIPRYSSWVRRDERYSGIATVQYQLTDDFDVYFEYQRNKRTLRAIDNNYVVDVTAVTRIDTANNCATCVIDDDGNLIAFNTAPTAPSATTGAGSIFNSQYRDFIQKFDSNYKQVGFNWDRDTVRISGLGVMSSGTTWTDTNSIQINATIPSIRVELDPENGNPSFTFPANASPTAINTYLNPVIPIAGTARPTVAEFQYRPDEVDVKEDMVKLDGDFDVESSFLKMIETGIQWRKSSSLRYGGGVNSTGTDIPNAQGQIVPSPYITARGMIGAANTPLAGTPGGTQVGSQTFTSATFANFLNGSTDLLPYKFFPIGDRPNVPENWLRPNFNNIGQYFDQTFVNHDRVREVNGVGQVPVHDIDETIYAAYLKGDLEFGMFGIAVNGNVGVRYTRTVDRSTGFFRTIASGQTNPNLATIVSMKNSYEDWLPSANFSFGLIPNKLIAFVGASKVLARPKPTDLVPNLTCNLGDPANAATQNTCTAGNPDLKPYRANQYDLSLSWYPNRDTLVSAALFYKDISNFIVPNVTTFDVDLFGDGQVYDIRRPDNAPGAKIKGVELTVQTAFTFLPAPFDGFGFQANYTYSDASDVALFSALTGEELSFPGLSKHSYNLVGYYDKGFLNLRVAWNARSKYLRVAAERSGNPVYNDATGYLDAKATFRFPKFFGASFFVEGKNLTKETERQTSGSIRMTEYSYSGRRFFVGASFKF